MQDRTPQLELDNQLCFALYDASRAMVRAYAPLLGELGLTYPQYLTMLVLWESDEGMGVGEIGARLHLDSGTLTPLLKRLADLGLVDRARDRADERRVIVTLTERGRTMRAHAADVPARAFACYGLQLEEAVDLLQRLRNLTATLTAAEPG